MRTSQLHSLDTALRPTAIARVSSLLVLMAIAATGCGDSPTESGPIDIDWGVRANAYPGDINTQFQFNCPAGGTPRSVWGTDTYTDDSSICTAGVHAGAITLADGGLVTIEIRPGRDRYVASTRNGVTSYSYSFQWERSFVVL